MQGTTLISPVDKTYTARFGGFFSLQQNPDLKGRGEIIINPGSKEIVFRAHRRAFLSNRQTEISFLPIDIENIRVTGSRIRFDTMKGRSGRDRRPFVFWLDNQSEVDALLPCLRGGNPPEILSMPDAAESPLQGPTLEYKSVTAGLVCVNVAVFVFMAVVLNAGWFTVSDLLPYVQYGANNGAVTSQGEWWRLLTSMFMHYGLPHLLFNMWALVSIGVQVERRVGRSLFLLVYFGTGIVGGLTSILVHGDKLWSAGASGAIFGLYGVFLGLLLRTEPSNPAQKVQPAIASTLLFVAYNVLYGIKNPGIDLAAHIGGLASGCILGGLTALPLDPDRRQRAFRKSILLCGAAVALMAGVGIASVPHYDTAVKDEFYFARVSLQYIANESGHLEKYRLALSRSWQAGADSKGDLARSATELKSFYHQWSIAVSQLQPSSPKGSAQKNELLAAMDKQTREIDTDLVRQAEMAAVKTIAEQLDIRMRSFNVQQVTATTPAAAHVLLNDLKEMGSHLHQLVTTTSETTEAKSIILTRIQETQRAITDAADQFENFAQLKAMAEEFYLGLQKNTKSLLQPETIPATAEAIAALEQQLIPFLDQWKTRLDQTAARSEPAAQLRTGLVDEVDNKLKKSKTLLIELRDSAMAERLTAITTDFTRHNQTLAERASVTTGNTKQDAENRIKLITTEIIPFLDDTERQIRAEVGESPKLNQARDGLLAEINRMRKNWVNNVKEYEGISLFLTKVKLIDEGWKARLTKLKEMIQTKGSELAARRYIMTDLIPFSEKSLEQLDQLNLTQAGQRLRAAMKDEMLKKNSELREMAAMWSVPRKR